MDSDTCKRDTGKFMFHQVSRLFPTNAYYQTPSVNMEMSTLDISLLLCNVINIYKMFRVFEHFYNSIVLANYYLLLRSAFCFIHRICM